MSVIEDDLLVDREELANKLSNIINYIEDELSSHNKLNIAKRCLECLRYILIDIEALSLIVNDKDNREHYASDRDHRLRVLRAPAPNNMSFHVISYDNGEQFQQTMQNYAAALTEGFESMLEFSTPEFYLDLFLEKIKDDKIGCMEARLGKAMQFLAEIASTGEILTFESLTNDFNDKLISTHPEITNISGSEYTFLFSCFLINYFSDKVSKPIIFEGRNTLLNWQHIVGYLSEIYAIEPNEILKTVFSFFVEQESIRQQVIPGKRVVLYFEEFEKSSFAKSVIEMFSTCGIEDHGEIISVNRGQYMYRLPFTTWDAINFQLENSQKESADDIGGNYLIKSIRSDKLNYFNEFARGILPHEQPQPKQVLRHKPKLKYTLMGDSIEDRSEKRPMYQPEEKIDYSQIQATTLVNCRARTTPFLFKSNNGHAGVMINVEDSLPNRLLINTMGTVYRPFEFKNIDAARSFRHLKNTETRTIYSPEHFDRFLNKISHNNQCNEYLARIKWNIESSKIAIFSDSLSSRLLAYTYAESISKHYQQQGYEDYFPPIIFYIPGQEKHLNYYNHYAHQKDMLTAIQYYSDLSLRLGSYNNSKFTFLFGLPDELIIASLTDQHKNNPLLLHLLRNGYGYIVKVLLDKLAPDIIEDLFIETVPYLEQNDSAIGSLIREEQFELADRLLSLSASDIRFISILGNSSIKYAAEYANTNIVGYIGYNEVLTYCFDQKLWHHARRILQESRDEDIDSHYYGILTHRAIKHNQPEIVRYLLDNHADKTVINSEGNTPAYQAAKDKKWQCLTVLSNYPTDEEDAENYAGALLFAIIYKKFHISEALVNAGAKLNYTLPEELSRHPDYYAIHYAVLYEEYDLLNMFISSGDDPNKRNGAHGSISAYALAIERDKVAAIDLLIGHDIYPDEQAIRMAFIYQKWDILDKILASLRDNEQRRYSPEFLGKMLHIAIDNKQSELVSLLLAHQADTTVLNESNNTPAFQAALNQQWDFLTLIIRDRSENDDASNYSSALLVAMKHKQFAISQFLLEIGATLNFTLPANETNNPGFYAMHYAILYDQYYLLLEFINLGDDPNKRSDVVGSLSAYELAFQEEKIDSINILLTKNIFPAEEALSLIVYLEQWELLHAILINNLAREQDIYSVEGLGLILFSAIASNKVEIVEQLMRLGADTSVRNNQSMTPACYAASISQWDCLAKIVQYSSLENDASDYSQVLLLSCLNHEFDIAMMLLSQGGTLDTYVMDGEYRGYSPIHLSVLHENYTSLAYFINRGADINIRNVVENTEILSPMELAIEKSDEALIDYLLNCNAYPDSGALFFAVKKQLWNIFTHLLERIDQENLPDDMSWASIAMHEAIKNNRCDVIEAICQKCPDVIYNPNNQGYIPFSHALIRKNRRSVSWFTQQSSENEHLSQAIGYQMTLLTNNQAVDLDELINNAINLAGEAFTKLDKTRGKKEPKQGVSFFNQRSRIRKHALRIEFLLNGDERSLVEKLVDFFDNFDGSDSLKSFKYLIAKNLTGIAARNDDTASLIVTCLVEQLRVIAADNIQQNDM